MAVWTVSWQEGSGGGDVARLLAGRAGVPLVDREVAEAIAGALGTRREQAEQIERGLPGRLVEIALCVGALPGAAALAVGELTKPETLREAVTAVFREAAHWPCVLLGRGGFAILADHPGAYHVRIRAPFQWRVDRHALLHYLSAEQAAKALERDDHKRAAYVRRIHGRDIDDPANFHLVVDASRFGTEEIVELLLVAARWGRHRGQLSAIAGQR